MHWGGALTHFDPGYFRIGSWMSLLEADPLDTAAKGVQEALSLRAPRHMPTVPTG